MKKMSFPQFITFCLLLLSSLTCTIDPLMPACPTDLQLSQTRAGGGALITLTANNLHMSQASSLLLRIGSQEITATDFEPENNRITFKVPPGMPSGRVSLSYRNFPCAGADSSNNPALIYQPVAVVSLLAGEPSVSGGYMEGVHASAKFNYPTGVDVDPQGKVYVADRGNHLIRSIDPATGQTAFLAGDRVARQPGHNDHSNPESIRFRSPDDLAFDETTGKLYIVEVDNFTVRSLAAVGSATVAGKALAMGCTDEVSGVLARFWTPIGITVNEEGLAFVTDQDDRRIRIVDPVRDHVSALIGVSRCDDNACLSIDGSKGMARFCSPNGIDYWHKEQLFFVVEDNKIRSVDMTGTVRTVDVIEQGVTLSQGSDVVADDIGNLYIADFGGHRILRVDAFTRELTVLAGSGIPGYANGIGTSAQFRHPEGIALNKATNTLYVADSGNHCIRKIQLQ